MAGFNLNPGDLRRVGKDALISFAGSFYSVPARLVRPGQAVVVRADAHRVQISARSQDAADTGTFLAEHVLAARKGAWVIDPAHWDGLPDGHTRATTTDTGPIGSVRSVAGRPLVAGSLPALLAAHAPDVHVAVRSLATYEAAMNG